MRKEFIFNSKDGDWPSLLFLCLKFPAEMDDTTLHGHSATIAERKIAAAMARGEPDITPYGYTAKN